MWLAIDDDDKKTVQYYVMAAFISSAQSVRIWDEPDLLLTLDSTSNPGPKDQWFVVCEGTLQDDAQTRRIISLLCDKPYTGLLCSIQTEKYPEGAVRGHVKCV